MATPGTSVDWIIQHSRRYPLLTAAEEITLARQVQAWVTLGHVESPNKKQKGIINRGRRARDRFFLSNIRLAVNVAGKYKKYCGTLTLEDLIQEGLIGLDSAILKFDPALGYKFSTYCYWWIRQGITRAINRHSRIIRLPMQANDVIRKSMDYMQQYVCDTGKLPPIADVAKHCNIQKETLLGYLNHNASVISLDQKMPGSERYGEFMDVVADPSSVKPEADDLDQFSDALREAIDDLCPAYQHIIERRYFHNTRHPTPFEEIGKDLEISRQATQQMHKRAMTTLRLKLGGLQGQDCIQALRSVA
jgi:RNA polymerase primary sigma factor